MTSIGMVSQQKASKLKVGMQESVLVQLIAHNHPHQPLHASEICILNMNKSNESNVGRGSKKNRDEMDRGQS